jgi:Tripartite tricarboxylate transporter family receptor
MKIKGAKASYGYGSPPALASAELYKVRAGLEALAVPYRTSMASLSEMFSGELDFQFIDATAVAPLLESAKLRGLAVTTNERIPGVDMATMAEAANIPEFDVAPVWGVLLPAGAPQPIVARLELWFEQISKLEATHTFLANTHGASYFGNAKALAEFIPKEIKKWEELSKIAKRPRAPRCHLSARSSTFRNSRLSAYPMTASRAIPHHMSVRRNMICAFWIRYPMPLVLATNSLTTIKITARASDILIPANILGMAAGRMMRHRSA